MMARKRKSPPAAKPERLRIEGPAGSATATGQLFPTNHWHAGVLAANRVLNTLTGRINQVTIEAAGPEAVEVAGGRLQATRYSYRGDLETTAWYDARKRWVKLRFQAKDGSTIDYLCLTCSAP